MRNCSNKLTFEVLNFIWFILSSSCLHYLSYCFIRECAWYFLVHNTTSSFDVDALRVKKSLILFFIEKLF